MAEAPDQAAREAEIRRNFEAFLARLPELMATQQGRFALLRHGDVVEIFDTLRDALSHASEAFPDGLYSVQEITDRVIDLGWFSRFGHAADHASV